MRSGFANYLAARSETAGLTPVGPVVDPLPHDVGAPARPGNQVLGANRSFPLGRTWRAGGGVLSFQKDGNLVVYNGASREALWASGTNAKGAVRLFMQGDGNLVIYAKGDRPLWASNTSGNPGARAIFQTDGNFVIYSAGGSPIWASNTQGFRSAMGGRGFLGDAVNFVADAVTSPVRAVVHTAGAIAQGQNVLNSLKNGLTESIGPGTKVLRAASPVLNVAAGLAAVVPGVGTGVASGLAMAAAVGRGASVGDIALEAARAAIPGGAIAKVAFDVAVGVATHQSATGIALAGIRNQIPGDAARAAFDAGLAVAYHASPKEAAHAVAALPSRAAKATFTAPVVAAAKARAKGPAMRAADQRKARAKTRPRNLSARGRAWIRHAVVTHARTRLDTGALSADGKTYTVEAGDSAWRITQNLTGDGNHHYLDLLRSNSPPKTIVRNGMTLAAGATLKSGDNFKYLSKGEKLKIPVSWIGKFVAVTAPNPPPPGSDTLSLPSPTSVPDVSPPPPAPPTPSPIVDIPPAPPLPLPPVVDTNKAPGASGERDDPQAIAQAKSILVAWEHTDGAAAAGLPDYGGNTADQSAIWGSRDAYELRAFVVWSNAHGTALSLLGDLTQSKLDALVAWAENKAKQVATGGGTVSPTGENPPAPVGGDTVTAPGASPISASGGPGATAVTFPAEQIPETSISGSTTKAGMTDGIGFGWGIAALGVLAIAVVSGSGGRKKAA